MFVDTRAHVSAHIHKATFNHEGKRQNRKRKRESSQEGRKEGRVCGREEKPTEGAPISIIVIIHLGLFPANAHS